MAKKFFTTKEVSAMPDCASCQLCDVVSHPMLRVSGEGRLGVMIIGDHPDGAQDDAGSYEAGKNYGFLNKSLEDIGIDLERDLWYVTVLGCRTPREREPSGKEIQYCYPRLKKIIDRLNPSVLILLGDAPFTTIIQPRIKGRLTGTPYNKFYGDLIPDQEMQKWLAPTWSIKELMETKEYEGGYTSKPFWERDKAVYTAWKTHLQNACAKGGVAVEVVDYASRCATTQDIDRAIDMVVEAMDWEYVAWDTETTGIRGFRKGHAIICVSISNGKVSYAFPFFDDKTFQKVLKRLMLSDIGKIGHNESFDRLWLRTFGGYWSKNTVFDTMLGMHCYMNLKPCGLKYVVYREFGVVGYDTEADEFLSSTKEEKEQYGDNAINRIRECPIDKLLFYNALDSLFTAQLYETLNARLTPFQMQGLNFLLESSDSLTKSQFSGVRMDVKQYYVVEKKLEDDITQLEKDIKATETYSKWDKPTEFNYNSGAQLGYLLYDVMKLKPVAFTGTNKPATDVEALEGVDNDMVQLILKQRKLQKLLGTYLHQYKTEEVDGILHPFTYLNRVDTFRSSMGSPNLQQSPKRDKFAKEYITSLILPDEGQRLAGYDLKAIEVAINACHSHDKNLMRFVNDPSQDMHSESAQRCFILDKSEVTKPLRQYAKQHNFRTLYGGYYKQSAPVMWEAVKEQGLQKHMAQNGIKTFAQFEAHMEKVEKWFWEEQFGEHNVWRKKQWDNYLKYGYLESLTGFRLYGPMKRNNAMNSKVQGDAYHCLQYTYNKMVAFLEEHNMKSRVLFEVHDALYFSVEPGEEDLIDYYVWWYGTQEIRREWTWLCVGIQFEKEIGPVNGSWSTLEGAGYLDGGGRAL